MSGETSACYAEFHKALDAAADVPSLLATFPKDEADPSLPKFGHAIKPLFSIAPENRSINFGSYGNSALPVLSARVQKMLSIDSDTDTFMRLQMFDEYQKVCDQLGQFVGLPAAANPCAENQGAEVFLCENAGWAINATVHSFVKNPLFHIAVMRDRIARAAASSEKSSGSMHVDQTIRVLKFSNAYPTVQHSLTNAVAQNDAQLEMERMLQEASGIRQPTSNTPKIKIVECTVTLAMLESEEGLIDEVVATALTGVSTMDRKEGYDQSGNHPVDVMFVDHLWCMPAMLLPLAAICQKVRAASPKTFIACDAAHAIGQVPLDFSSPEWRMPQADGSPSKGGNTTELVFDVYWSNCHKWLMSPKSSAILVLSKRALQFFHPTVIANFYHGEESDMKGEPVDPKASGKAAGQRMARLKEMTWLGTQDFSNDLIMPQLLSFRKSIGGEARIMEHNRDLAYRGAELIAAKFGSRLVVPGRERNGCIVSVLAPEVCQKNSELFVEVIKELLSDHNTIAPWMVTKVIRESGPGTASTRCFCIADPGTRADNEAAGVEAFVGVRVSAQVYNEIGDYEYWVDTFLRVLKEKQK